MTNMCPMCIALTRPFPIYHDFYLMTLHLPTFCKFKHMSCYFFPHVNYLLQDIAECTLIFDTITGTYTTLTFK